MTCVCVCVSPLTRFLRRPQHLTTFVLDRKDGMITVDDGIRRLRLLDAKGKVWTQEMLLQVEEKAVSLIDPETKVRSSLSTCERHLSLSQVDEPQRRVREVS